MKNKLEKKLKMKNKIKLPKINEIIENIILIPRYPNLSNYNIDHIILSINKFQNF